MVQPLGQVKGVLARRSLRGAGYGAVSGAVGGEDSEATAAAVGAAARELAPNLGASHRESRIQRRIRGGGTKRLSQQAAATLVVGAVSGLAATTASYLRMRSDAAGVQCREHGSQAAGAGSVRAGEPAQSRRDFPRWELLTAIVLPAACNAGLSA